MIPKHLEIMQSKIGTKESPIGSNTDSGGFIDKSNAFFGLYKVPWCASGLSKILRESGVAVPVNSARALDFKIIAAFSLTEVSMKRETPEPGDVVGFNYGGGRGHVDVVEYYDPVTDTWYLIGCNRSDGVNRAVYTTNELLMRGAKWVAKVEYPKHKCIASWYGPGFQGNKTANGETYNMNDTTAAHKDFEYDTLLRVTNPSNGKQVIVRINDRGPFVDGVELDLSKAAAWAIGLRKGKVIYEVINGN
jgi:hypothetical protein